ncbi:MAG: aldo/keto reductase [Candidatus Latescibacterota bacterium]|jgi:aryl-alcohol dehydrogenase-like predicted oxidoreductase
METRLLGTTDLQVSRLGLGTVELGMPYGLGLPEPPDDDTCIRFLHQAYDAGITFVDTAAAYGRSEELIGRAFGGNSKRPVIATKVALRPAGSEARLHGTALKEHVEGSVRRSLARLQIPVLDLLQVHSADERFVDAEFLELAEDLTGRGLVRYWGASTYGETAPLEVLDWPVVFRSLQVAYNLLDRRLDAQVLPRCRQQGVGVLFRSVLLQGVLSDRWQTLPPRLAPLQEAARLAAALAAQAGLTLAELAVRFTLHHPVADTVLFGSSRFDELQANLAAVDAGPLPANLMAAVATIQVNDPLLLHPGNWHLQSSAIPRG